MLTTYAVGRRIRPHAVRPVADCDWQRRRSTIDSATATARPRDANLTWRLKDSRRAPRDTGARPTCSVVTTISSLDDFRVCTISSPFDTEKQTNNCRMELESRRRPLSANRHLLAVMRFQLCTYGSWAFSVAGPTVQNSLSLSRILSGTRRSVQTVSDVCLKRIRLLDTSASNAFGVLDDICAVYIYLHTYLLAY